MTSSVLMITTFFTSMFYAPACFQSLRLPQQSMAVHLLPEALNSTMRQGTIVECLKHSTAPFVPLLLACHQTHGQIAALNPPFATCSSKILTKFFTTMLLNTPYPPANLSAHLTILLIGTNACTPYIISSMWGEIEDVCLALGGLHGNLALIRWRLLAISKIAINTIYIWTTDPDLPFLAPESQNFKCLPPTLQTLLLHSCEKITDARKSVPLGAASAKLMTDNLQAHTLPDKSPFKTTKQSNGITTSY
jgi:hypothetical protein